MKITWFRSLMVLAAIAVIAALVVVAALLYLGKPVFGQMPQGEQLSLIERSPNHVDGAFQNLVDTPFLTAGATQLSIQIDNLRAEKGSPRPPHDIPAQKTDLKSLDVNEDLVVWLGHSSWYVQLAGQRILIDPVFSANAAPLPGFIEAFAGTSIYSADDLPRIDVLLITHDHFDHLDYPTILALESMVERVVTGLGVGAHFESWGYDAARIDELDWHDTIALGDGLVLHATPARHYSGRTFTRNKSLWVGFAMETPQRRIFFSGDSGYGAHFSAIGERHGPFDWVALDTGQYDPRWANLHMNPEQAAQAAVDLGARALTPQHVGRFTLAPHDWNDPFERLVEASKGRDYALWTPTIGQPVHFDNRPQVFAAWWTPTADHDATAGTSLAPATAPTQANTP
ncbi:MAG TPA: MBL fold metallo-hydrolase [Lysobacter sp.]|nr:MBL fold metallo-hydrolase [Lysobacter sp.]